MASRTSGAALLIIDMQCAIDDLRWGARNNPEAEENVAALLSRWRLREWPVVHVRYESAQEESTFRGEGLEFKTCALPKQGEKVITKPGACAFIGTDMLTFLISHGIQNVVVIGVITNNSVEATVRVSAELGFHTTVVSDATFTFGQKDYNGVFRGAEEVHAMSLANLAGQYAKVVRTAELLA